MKPHKVRVGIIGTGKHGSRYARHIVNDIPGLELSAISRRSSEGGEQSREWNCRWHKEWQELVSSPEVDAVISVVPPALNLQIAKACIGAGKPLLMEKPLATKSKDAFFIARSFDEAGLPLTVGQTLRWNSVIRGLRENFERLGKCLSFVVNQRIEPSTLPWLEDPRLAGSGVSLHMAVHLFDALRFITGSEIQEVFAVKERVHNPNLDDLLLAHVRCEKFQGLLDTSKITPARTGTFEFMGEKGILRGDQIYGKLEWIEGTKRTPLTCQPPGPAILPMLEAWRTFLVTGKGNPVSGHEGAVAVAACEACTKSAVSGRWQPIQTG